MRQGAEPVIRVTDLKKYYGDVKAVDGVTFEVAQGEVFGMLGPNGAGKTTTIEVLEGLRPPDSGSVEVLGLDVRRHPQSIKERLGVQLQSVSLYPRLTVTELLGPLRQLLQPSRADEAVDRCGRPWGTGQGLVNEPLRKKIPDRNIIGNCTICVAQVARELGVGNAFAYGVHKRWRQSTGQD